jgi:hypothetical protein
VKIPKKCQKSQKSPKKSQKVPKIPKNGQKPQKPEKPDPDRQNPAFTPPILAAPGLPDPVQPGPEGSLLSARPIRYLLTALPADWGYFTYDFSLERKSTFLERTADP